MGHHEKSLDQEKTIDHKDDLYKYPEFVTKNHSHLLNYTEWLEETGKNNHLLSNKTLEEEIDEIKAKEEKEDLEGIRQYEKEKQDEWDKEHGIFKKFNESISNNTEIFEQEEKEKREKEEEKEREKERERERQKELEREKEEKEKEKEEKEEKKANYTEKHDAQYLSADHIKDHINAEVQRILQKNQVLKQKEKETKKTNIDKSNKNPPSKNENLRLKNSSENKSSNEPHVDVNSSFMADLIKRLVDDKMKEKQNEANNSNANNDQTNKGKRNKKKRSKKNKNVKKNIRSSAENTSPSQGFMVISGSTNTQLRNNHVENNNSKNSSGGSGRNLRSNRKRRNKQLYATQTKY